MNYLKRIFLLAFLCFGTAAALQAQTFNRVYNIFQAQCSSCHSGVTPAGSLNLGGSQDEVYNAIVNVTPANSVAAAKGDKLVKPGYVYNSFLFRKMHGGICGYDCDLAAGEGQSMPQYGTNVSKAEAEIIRQWILWGAPKTGSPVDEAVIEEYYTDGGAPFISRPPAPEPGKGFQVHVGPIFVKQNLEKEYNIKFKPPIDQPTEITGIDVNMNEESHHYILYKYNTLEDAGTVSEGLREYGILNFLDANNEMVSAWQDSHDYELPAGTAYRWDENTTLDINYHTPNFSPLGAVPFECYMNVYTQDNGIAKAEMHAELLLYNNPAFFVISPLNEVLQESIFNGPQWNIWQITSHTHKYGRDFDVYVRDDNGNKGEQIFEGKENGYYDWSHPPVNYYEPFYQLPAGQGLIHRAEYDVPGVVTFGLTTNEEMMITMIQYTEGEAIPFVKVSAAQKILCSNSKPIDLTLMPAEGGVLAGTGVVNNTFDPAIAGVGTHTITYTYQDIVDEYTFVVEPAISTPTITKAGTTLSVSNDYANYQWYMNGTPIDGATQNTLTITDPTATYTVMVTSAGGCAVLSEPLAVGINTPNAWNNPQGVVIAPNPMNNNALLTYNVSQNAKVNLQIYNVIGQKIATLLENEWQNAGTHQVAINAQKLNLTAGIYFANLTVNGKTTAQKVVVK